MLFFLDTHLRPDTVTLLDLTLGFAKRNEILTMWDKIRQDL
jgi:hypothetical protein